MDNFAQLRVNKAFEHFQKLKSKVWWTSFNMTENDIWVSMGPIHTNGTYERAVKTRRFYNNIDGSVEWVDEVHY